MRVPPNGCFIGENPQKWMMSGGSLISGKPQMALQILITDYNQHLVQLALITGLPDITSLLQQGSKMFQALITGISQTMTVVISPTKT